MTHPMPASSNLWSQGIHRVIKQAKRARSGFRNIDNYRRPYPERHRGHRPQANIMDGPTPQVRKASKTCTAQSRLNSQRMEISHYA
jgi:hypothetical protein